MNEWAISIVDWGNGYCEWKASNPDELLPFHSRSLPDLFKQVQEHATKKFNESGDSNAD